jgi:MFS family permease
MLMIASLGHPALIAACIIPIGACGALAMPSVTGVVLEGVPAKKAGTASAVFNTFRQVGGAVAIAVFGALIANPDHVAQGLRLSLGIVATLLLLAALSSLRINRGPNPQPENRLPAASTPQTSTRTLVRRTTCISAPSAPTFTYLQSGSAA